MSGRSRELLSNGELVVFCDGLDEVTDSGQLWPPLCGRWTIMIGLVEGKDTP